MNLFSETKSKDYFDNLLKIVKNEIEKLSDEEIIKCGVDEWKEYYLNKYIQDIIEIQQSNEIIGIREEKIKESNYFASSNPIQSDYYLIDGYKITIKINFIGNMQLLKLIPSTRILRKFIVEDIKYNLENEICELYFALLYKKEELDNKSDLKEFVLNDFTNKFKDYIKNVMLINQIEKIDTVLGSIKFTKSTSTEIYDESLIDKKFIEIVTTEKISKEKIKSALKAGEEVQGARLIVNKNLKVG